MATSSLQTKLADQWDPQKCRHEQLSPQCLLKVKEDVSDFFAKPPSGLFICPEEDDVTGADTLVEGPPGIPYDGGFFQFLLKFPPGYPLSPPGVRIMTTDSGRVSFNTNLYANCKICLSILGTWYGPACSPAQCAESVLVSIQSALNVNPYFNEPGTSPSQRKAALAKNYNDIIQYKMMRVALCDMGNAALNDSPQCPQAFRKHIFKCFPDSYEKYAGVAMKNLHLTGTATGALQYGGVFAYGKVLERLKGLKRMVKTVEGAAGQANQWKPL